MFNFLFTQCSIYQFTSMVVEVAVILSTEKSLKFRDESFQLACWVKRDTVSQWNYFYLEKNQNTEVREKTHKTPLPHPYSFN